MSRKKNIEAVSTETHGSPCQRCEEMTDAIQCVYADYWLCPKCALFHKTLAAKWRGLNESLSPSSAPRRYTAPHTQRR